MAKVLILSLVRKKGVSALHLLFTILSQLRLLSLTRLNKGVIMDNKLLCSVCDFYFVPAEVPQCTRCGYVEPDAIPSSYDVAKNKG